MKCETNIISFGKNILEQYKWYFLIFYSTWGLGCKHLIGGTGTDIKETTALTPLCLKIISEFHNFDNLL
jgi:hypothetical protein